MQAMPVVVLLSGSGSNLQALIDSLANNQAVNLCAVISNNPNAYGLERAKAAGIDAVTLDHRQFSSREAYDHELQSVIDQFEPGLVVLAGFMRILTASFVEHYHGRMLNIHPSLLPKYKGLNTHARALQAGDAEHGLSIHFVTADLDGGPIVIQAKLAIDTTDDVNSLQQKIHHLEHRYYPQAVSWFAEKRVALKDDGVYFDQRPLGISGVQFDHSRSD